jgi:hypothetical protein
MTLQPLLHPHIRRRLKRNRPTGTDLGHHAGKARVGKLKIPYLRCKIGSL